MVVFVHFSAVICWTSPFVILGELSLFCRFFILFFHACGERDTIVTASVRRPSGFSGSYLVHFCMDLTIMVQVLSSRSRNVI